MSCDPSGFFHRRLCAQIRQAVLQRFALTQESLPDAEALEHARTNDIWRDWAPIVRDTPTAGGETEDDTWTEIEGLRFTETGWFPVDGVETPFEEEVAARL